MNAISTALKTAGVKLPPLNKRVWLWLHDHPGKSAKVIALALKDSPSQVGTVLRDMERRGMVVCFAESVRSGSAGHHKKVFTWRTLIPQYTLLPMPMPKKVKADTRPLVVQQELPSPKTREAEGPVDTRPQPTVKGFDMESCTLRELRALYVSLKELFE